MHPRAGYWMSTLSGNRIYLDDPKPEDFTIEDIAHGLSNTGRYNGQAISFYSVAEHTYRGSLRTGEILGFESNALAYEFLMHDAAEAFVGDMVAPLKLMMPQYTEVEERIQAAIATRFGFNATMTAECKLLDKRMLVTEAAAMFRHNDKWWLEPSYPKPFTDEFVLAKDKPRMEDSRMSGKPSAALVDAQFMPPRMAKRLWLERYGDLRHLLGMDGLGTERPADTAMSEDTGKLY